MKSKRQCGRQLLTELAITPPPGIPVLVGAPPFRCELDLILAPNEQKMAKVRDITSKMRL